ncbi:hypothetical protein ACE7GA_00415 [Roseomonas sp. CCTCC AB2023176]|uniref:hypothetical protein n=1 Tax=Roseomonas sp. CCTCC AB2023176 TaxID=3342640 RepID=UPI0035DC6448
MPRREHTSGNRGLGDHPQTPPAIPAAGAHRLRGPHAARDTLFHQTGISRRLLSVEQAAAYCGMSRRTFDEHIRPRLKALRFTSRVLFDRVRLDEELDRLSSPLAHAPEGGDALAARLRSRWVGGSFPQPKTNRSKP